MKKKLVTSEAQESHKPHMDMAEDKKMKKHCNCNLTADYLIVS